MGIALLLKCWTHNIPIIPYAKPIKWFFPKAGREEGDDTIINIGFESLKCSRTHTHNKHKISIFWLALTLSGKVRGLVVTTTYAQHGCSNRGKPMQYIAVPSSTSVTTAQFWALAMSSNAVHQVLNG